MSQLKLEAGKYYKARNGEKVFISYIAQANPFLSTTKDRYPAKGWIRGQGTLHCWTEGGMRCAAPIEDHSPSDLIEEWKEPVTEEVVMGLFRGRDGRYECFKVVKTDYNEFWTLIGSTRVKVIEGQFA